MDDNVSITFQPDGKHGRVTRGRTIMEAARVMGVEVASICGGNEACGKCKVVVKAVGGDISPVTADERAHLSEEELNEGLRLACAARIWGNATVVVPEGSRRGRQRLQTEGIETPVELDPFVKKISLKLSEATTSDQRSDEDLLFSALRTGHGLGELRLGLEAARNLPVALREGEQIITVTLLDGREIIDVEAGATSERTYGIAVDIGTTKLACYLVDLVEGTTLSVGSVMNPQISFGEDVMTRIEHTMKEPEGLRELHESVIRGINQIIRDVCDRAEVRRKEVYEMAVAGNTVMHHLFLDIPPRFLASSPYTPAVSGSLTVEAHKLGIDINPGGNVYALPIIAGFIGSDCVAGILATGTDQSEETSLLIDVGTNTEIVLAKGGELSACSCASGPAFEGAHIKHGMRAASGAIERAWIDRNTLDVRYLTIEDAAPRGICGSGIVDLLAEMLKAGVIDSTGRISVSNNNPRVRSGGDGNEFVVAWGNDTASGEDIVLTQQDVRELQKAKAAIHTGASVLMARMGVATDDVERIYIAGAFGNYLDSENMRAIGMLPDFPIDRVTGVGNAAGTGTRMALLSREIRGRAEEIRRRVNYVELASDPSFQDEYLKSLNMPHMDLRRFPRAMEKLRGSRFKAVHTR